MYKYLFQGGYALLGARARSRTGTAIRPRDFKSLASTSFATRADTVFVTDKQLLSDCTRTIIPQERFCFCAIPEESACHEVLTRSACYYRRHADINAE